MLYFIEMLGQVDGRVKRVVGGYQFCNVFYIDVLLGKGQEYIYFIFGLIGWYGVECVVVVNFIFLCLFQVYIGFEVENVVQVVVFFIWNLFLMFVEVGLGCKGFFIGCQQYMVYIVSVVEVVNVVVLFLDLVQKDWFDFVGQFMFYIVSIGMGDGVGFMLFGSFDQFLLLENMFLEDFCLISFYFRMFLGFFNVYIGRQFCSFQDFWGNWCLVGFFVLLWEDVFFQGNQGSFFEGYIIRGEQLFGVGEFKFFYGVKMLVQFLFVFFGMRQVNGVY